MNWNPLLYTELVNVLTMPMEQNNFITIRLLSIYQILSITLFLLYMFFNSSRVKPNQYNIGLGYFRFIFGLFSILYYCFTLNQNFNPIILINVISLIFSIIKNAELSNEMVDYNIVTSESIPYLTKKDLNLFFGLVMDLLSLNCLNDLFAGHLIRCLSKYTVFPPPSEFHPVRYFEQFFIFL